MVTNVSKYDAELCFYGWENGFSVVTLS